MIGGAPGTRMFGWSTKAGLDVPAMLAAGLGTGSLLAASVLAGRPSLGLAAATGALMLGTVPTGASLRLHAGALAACLAAAAVAVASAAGLGRSGLSTDAIAIGLSAAAAVMGGYSRPLAVAAGRFIVFLAIARGVVESAGQGPIVAVPIVAGALWASALAILFGGLARGLGWSAPSGPASGRAATREQRLRRWRASLREVSGWHYAGRLVVSLGIAALLRVMWPDHHFAWIGLTVAILTQRQIERWPVRALQRSIGAACGVALIGSLVAQPRPAWLVAGLIALLAGLRPWLRTRSYLAYTATMTPLVILLLDAGRPIDASLLVDRVAATLIAAGLVVATDLLAATIVAPAP